MRSPTPEQCRHFAFSEVGAVYGMERMMGRVGNKSVYRTRMALADDAELIVLAPGVGEFGEDAGSMP